MASEKTLLRRELVAAHATIFDRDKEIVVLREQVASERTEKESYRAQLASAKAKLALYEGPNAPSSTKSQFNARRNSFRKKRGSRGSDGSGSDRPAGPGGGRKKGPPAGHAGVSHAKPAVCMKYPASRCACGAELGDKKLVHKLVSDFGKCLKMITFDAVIETGWCPRCERRVSAPSPFLEGTSLGPVALGLVAELFGMRCTDSDISRLFESFFRFKMSASAVASARGALSAALDAQMESVKRAFLRCDFVQGDETGIKIGVAGKTGYVWVFVCRLAVFVVAVPQRGAPVLREHFAWLLHLPVVSDGLAAYGAVFEHVQRCWRHLLARAEAAAVDGGPADVARYEQLLRFYRKLKGVGALNPFTVHFLAREIRALISSFPEGKLKNHLRNAEPDMSAFLSHPGMPPHNNAAELAIRDGPVRQRNARHHITTPDGRRIFSRLLTLIMTCRMNGVFPCRAVVEILRDRQWDMFRPGPESPPDWSVFDAPASGLVRPPGAARAGRLPAPAAAA